MDVLVAGQNIENAINETVEWWIKSYPAKAKTFSDDMNMVRDGFKGGAMGHALLEIPETLFEAIARRLSTDGKPNFNWTRDAQCLKFFKRSFVVGLCRPKVAS